MATLDEEKLTNFINIS